MAEMKPEVLEGLDSLARELVAAKVAESAAKASRLAIESKIVALVAIEKGKKQVTLPLPSSTKIVVKQGNNYKADVEAIKRLFNSPQLKELELPAPIETKDSLSVKGYEWYRENHPDVYVLLAEHVTVTPAKASVAVQSPKK